MRDLGVRQWVYLSLTTGFLIAMLFVLLFHTSKPLEWGDRRRILLKPPTNNPEGEEKLVQVLRRASMSDRTVILTMVDKAWASPGSILDVFLQGLRVGEGTQKFLNHLVIVTMDSQAFHYCTSLHPYCLHPSISSHYVDFIRKSTGTSNHNLFSWKRNYLLYKVLQLGYNLIYTDADVIWLRSPLPHFHNVYDLSISCDFSSYEQRGGNAQDGGLFFVKSSQVSYEFFKLWNVRKIQYPDSHVAKSICSDVWQNQDAIEAYGFRTKDVNATYFGGFCQLNKDEFRMAYTMHANCCEDLQSKIHDLKLFLHDWIHFRAHLSKNYTVDELEHKDLRWRAPLKCLK